MVPVNDFLLFLILSQGQNPCDTEAAHIKQHINVAQRDREIALRNVEQTAQVISELKGHTSMVIPEASLRLKSATPKKKAIQTFKGIKSYHCFTFPEPGVVCGLEDSELPLDHHSRRTWRMPEAEIVLLRTVFNFEKS